jgi:FtsH-binding integral membrane protein
MAIVIKDNKVEIFEISEGDLKLIKVGSAQSAENPSNKEAIDLYKMEYQRCAQRYDDLYRAAWTIFSYLALVAGAVLTFGADRFMPELSIFFATLPLLFWWTASFEPLNRYGDQVEARLKWVEKLINKLGSLNLESDEVPEEYKGLRHFQHFASREAEAGRSARWGLALFLWMFLLTTSLAGVGLIHKPDFWFSVLMVLILLLIWWMYEECSGDGLGTRLKELLRVRFIVRAFASAILIVAICSAYGAYQRHNVWHESYIRRTLPETR